MSHEASRDEMIQLDDETTGAARADRGGGRPHADAPDILLGDLHKTFGVGAQATAAVADVDLHIEGGEFFFLLGPSGCGKTTLLRMIAGLVEPTRGSIAFGGRDVTNLAVEQRNTAMVFQNYALWPHMTVRQNVEFGPRMRGVKRAERKRIAGVTLDLVEMGAYAQRKPNQLSGGQQQRVALARALAARPDCLLLDEPLSNLDARLRLYMRDELRRLVKDSGTTAVYVTHDQKEALSMADRLAVMDAGRIVQVGTPVDVYHRPATRFVADFLGEANFIEGQVARQSPRPAIGTAVGLLYLDDDEPAPAGEVTCCVRPEHIEVHLPTDELPANAAAFRARLTRATFLGEIHQYLCTLDDGQTWKITTLATGQPPLPAGTDVTLTIHPRNVAVLA